MQFQRFIADGAPIGLPTRPDETTQPRDSLGWSWDRQGLNQTKPQVFRRTEGWSLRD